MTQISDTELAQGNMDLWFNWLRAGLIAYVSDDPVPVRYRAFSPLVVDPQSGNPASDLVRQIRTIPVERSGVAESAAIEALRHWSLSSDGWEPAALLVSVAVRLGGRGVADAIWGLVARSSDLPADARAELAFVAVEAAKLRYKYNDIVRLIELLWAEELATPPLLATLAVLLSRKDHVGLKMMPAKLAHIMPALLAPPHSGDFVRAIAAALRENYGIEDRKAALLPIDNEDPEIADFRRVLLHLSGDGVVFTMNLPEEARRRVSERISILGKLEDPDVLSDLAFPGAPMSAANNDSPDRS